MTRDDVLALIERHQEAFRTRDAATLASNHVEDGTFESQAAGLVRGRANIQVIYQYWLQAFPDLTFTWREPIIDGDRVALFWHFRGTLTGEFFGHSRPGTRVEFLG